MVHSLCPLLAHPAHLALQLTDGFGQLGLWSLGQCGVQVGAYVFPALLPVLELRRRKELEVSPLPGCGPFKSRARPYQQWMSVWCYLALQLRCLLGVQRLQGLSQLVVLTDAGLLFGSVLVLCLGGITVSSR